MAKRGTFAWKPKPNLIAIARRLAQARHRTSAGELGEALGATILPHPTPAHHFTPKPGVTPEHASKTPKGVCADF